MRMLTFARAVGERVFEASATEVASRASTVMEGRPHTRSAIGPVPVSWTPGSNPASSAMRSCG